MLGRDPFDLKQLRIDPKQATKLAKPRQWRRHYVNVPWYWVQQLQTSRRVCTYRVALWLLYEHWRTGGKPIVLSNVGVREEGLGRYSKWRTITELQDRGLIKVKTAPGKSPRITLCHLSEGPTCR